LFILQLVVILGIAVFNLSGHFFVGARAETGLSFALGQGFAYFLAGTIVLYNAVVTSLTEVGDPRYRVPTEPLIIFMCFLGFYLWRQLLLRAESRQAPNHS